MSAYLICRVTVADPAIYSQYTALSPDIIQAYGGRFLAREAKLMSWRGTNSPDGLSL